MSRLVALAVVLAACGDNTIGGAASGSRLALYANVYEDGTTQLTTDTFRDLARAEDCTLETWADTTVHCTPAWTETAYTDAACRTFVARVAAGTSPRYGRTTFAGATSRLYPLGEVTTTDAQYFHVVLGSCIPTPEDPGTTHVTVRDEELASSDFATIARVVEPVDDRLALVRYTSPDGLSAPFAYRDTELELDCTGRAGSGATTDCAPLHAVAPVGFADASCTVPAATEQDVGAADAIEVATNGCPSDYYAMTSNRLFSGVWFGSPAKCSAGSVSNAVMSGARLSLATLARTHDVTASRFSTNAFGPPLLGVIDAYVHDKVLQTDCKPIDGRCVPDAIDGATTAYADPACTVPIQVAYARTPVCSSPRYVMVDHRLHVVGGMAPPVYAPLDVGSGQCFAVTKLGYEAYLVGELTPALGAVTRQVIAPTR